MADLALPELHVNGPWHAVLEGEARARLEAALPRFLAGRRWFGGKARTIARVELLDAAPLGDGDAAHRLLLLRVSYAEGEPETYSLPVAFAAGERAARVRADLPGAELAAVEADEARGILYASYRDPDFGRALLDAIARGRRFEGRVGALVAAPTHAFERHARGVGGLVPVALGGEQSNTSIRFGDRLILKLFRRTEAGRNPDLELGMYLTDEAEFRHVPPALGAIEWQPVGGEAHAIALLQGFVPNEGDAWSYVLGLVARFLAEATAGFRAPPPAPERRGLGLGLALDLEGAEPPRALRELAPRSLAAAALLGRRTAELHLALAGGSGEAFRPEPFSSADRERLHDRVRAVVRDGLALLRRRRDRLPPEVRARADLVLANADVLEARLRRADRRAISALRTRTHGDYHLGQVLWTGTDFVLIDFEGEPARPLAERRAKDSPLRDVAGMIRSFHYAAHQGLATFLARHPEASRGRAEGWAALWHAWVTATYLRAYLEVARHGTAIPQAPDELRDLLDLYVMEKAVYELSYELNNRPEWVALPLEGIAALAGPDVERTRSEEDVLPKKGTRETPRAAAREATGPTSARGSTGSPRTDSSGTVHREPVSPDSVHPEPIEGRTEAPGAVEGRTVPVRADPVMPGGGPGDWDRHLWNEGTNYRAYRSMGAHLATVEGVAGVSFAVWAPNAALVTVIGDFNGWNKDTHALRQLGDSGIWQGFVPGVRQGATYKFHVRSRHHGFAVDKADPFGFMHETAPATQSIVWNLDDYAWQDGDWMKGRHAKNALASPMSVYEVHLGSWRRNPEEGNRSLTYREAGPLLAAYCAEHGFTHVELLPIMEHPFYGSWGYQTTGYFAPTSRYGTPQDFMFLVDTLHQHGIGVLLDWVPSHFPTDEFGLAYFDGTHLFEHADRRQGHHPDWDSFIFNYGRNEVRSFLLSSALFWLDRYHVDGLRVDAVASTLYLDYSRKEGEWIPNKYGGRENLEAIAFLRKLNEVVYAEYPDVQTVAEESTSWPMVSRPLYVGGLGFGMKWDMGWMHDTLEYFKHEPVHRKFHHNQITFRMMYAFTENFVLALSHDEVVHGKRSLLGKMPGDAWQKFANLRLLYGYMWAQPGKKLLFMGGEFGQGQEWGHDRSLDWHLLGLEPHAGLQRWVRDLNAAMRENPALHVLDFDGAGFEWIDANDAEASVLSFLRKGRPGDPEILVVLNATPIPRDSYRIGVPRGGWWREILNSDAALYGGTGWGNMGGQEAAPVGAHGRLYSLALTLPPLGAVFLRREG
jgi:1,4-alpha-glucan branching enzyme